MAVARFGPVFLLLALAPGTRAGDDRPTRAAAPELQAKIHAAIDQGVKYLKSVQLRDGSWEYERGDAQKSGGLTALALYALAASGVPAKDKAIRSGLRWVAKHDAPFGASGSYATYSVSLLILALTRIDEKEHRERIHELARLLVEGQLTSGAWTYRLGRPGVRRDAGGRARVAAATMGDNSNSQFAVLALWAAFALADFPAPAATWERIRALYGRTQLDGGGWAYAPMVLDSIRNRGFGGTPSMTSAGLCSYVYATAALTGGVPALPEARRTEVAQRGVNALLAHPGPRLYADYYSVYSLERAGTVMAIPEEEWYFEGAEALVAAQRTDGRWSTQGSFGDKASAYETALALLFLSRATRHAVTPGGDPDGRRGPVTRRDAFPDPEAELERAFEYWVAYKPEDRARVVHAFGKGGAEAVELCVRKLRDGSAGVREAAFALLSALVEKRFLFEPGWPAEERELMLAPIDTWWRAEGADLVWDPLRKVFRPKSRG